MSTPDSWNGRQWALDSDVVADSYDPSLVDGKPVLKDLLAANGDLRTPRGKACIVWDGTTMYQNAPGIAGTESITNSGTATPTVSAGRIDWTAGTCWDIKVDGVTVWYANEENGRDLYANSSAHAAGNADIVNGTVAVFRATDNAVDSNPANDVGYTDNAGVIVPRNEAIPTQDVLGGALQFQGRGPLPIVVQSPVGTFDGVDDYADLNVNPGFSNRFTVDFWCRPIDGITSQYVFQANDLGAPQWAVIYGFVDNTFEFFAQNPIGTNPRPSSEVALTPDGNWHRITYVYDGTTWEGYLDGQNVFSVPLTFSLNPLVSFQNSQWGAALNGGAAFNGQLARCALLGEPVPPTQTPQLSDYWGYWPMCEGGGSLNFDVSGNGRHLTITNANLNDFWQNRTNTVRDHAVEYGGRIGASSEFIPGLLDGSSAADGNPITLLAGHHGNPYSRLIYDHWNVPELGGINYPAASPPGELLRTVAPANTKFRSEQNPTELADGTPFADGDNRLFTLPSTQWSQAIADYISRSAAPPAWLPAAAVKSTVLLGAGIAR